MKTTEVNIRDPFVLVYNHKYYLYGTRSATCWGKADGFDCYVSEDMDNWQGPIEFFHRPEGFFADQNYWAPECYSYHGSFYLVTTLGAEDRKKGVYILKADQPTGPFVPYSEQITPKEWASIDGTLYFEGEVPYLIFSHSFEDQPDGDMCVVELSKDLKEPMGEPKLLFSANEAEWAHSVPFAKKEFGMDGDVYFTDGPCVFKLSDGTLTMTWSSWGTKGYAIGQAISKTGNVFGPWEQIATPFWPENGGHGMIFTDLNGQQQFTLHYPNDKYQEHPCFYRVREVAGKLTIDRSN